MVEYSKVNAELSIMQLKKLTAVVKDNTGATLRMGLKIFNHDNLPHELLLATRQKRKLINAFNNNMSTDVKLYKDQMTKIVQSV